VRTGDEGAGYAGGGPVGQVGEAEPVEHVVDVGGLAWRREAERE
jgi:hypothetical protein